MKKAHNKSFPDMNNVRKGSGALGNTTDKLKARKPTGYIKSKPMIPHIRGEC